MSISENMKKNLEIDSTALIPNLEGKSISIDISGICNMDCIYCFYAAAKVHKKAGLIDPELFFSVTKQAYELGVRKVGLYLQGEPLLNPRLIEYIRYLKQLGYTYIYMSTNGITCDEKLIEQMVEAGLDSLKFSIGAFSREGYIQHHGVDAFERVVKNIKHAKAYRDRTGKDFRIYIFFIRTSKNEGEVELMRETLTPYVDEIAVHNVADKPIRLDGVRQYLFVGEQQYYSEKPPCAEAFNRVSVSVDGYLLSCCGPVYDTNKIADLHKMTLKAAWECPAYVKFRQRHLDGDLSGTICNRCMNGVIEPILPLTEEYGFQPLTLESVDIAAKIRERFGIEE